MMEFFGWIPPGDLEELTDEYRGALLRLISERRAAEQKPKKKRPGR
jgi:hypothetical protein